MTREYTIPVKQSGHQVTDILTPPTVSFTISWRDRWLIEYALASPLYSTPRINSSGAYSSSASLAERNFGSSMAGIASGGKRVIISKSL